MRARTIRFTAAFQTLLLLATLLLPALTYAEEPDASSSPPPTEQPSDPPSDPPTEPPADPTEPPPAEPDPTSAPEPTTAPEPSPDPTPVATPYAPSGPPSVSSDKADYGPGELVTLTGTNWLAGESVHIYVNDDHGSTWSRHVDVFANASGEIADAFNLPDWFVAEYVVIATGAQSGMAITTFTDGNVRIRSNGSLVTFTLTFTEHTGSTCTGTQTGSGTETGVGFSGGAQHTEGVGNTESIKLTAAATSDQGFAFSHWVANNGTDPFTVVSAQTICVNGNFGGTREYVAVYTANGSIEWEKRDDLNAPQGGATFTVAPNPVTGNTATYTVVDNGANDTDPDAGQIKIAGVSDAETYTITETVAPAGFAIDSDATRDQAVTSGARNPVVGTQGTNDAGTTNESDFHNRLGTLAWEKRTTVSPFPLQGGATFTISPNPFSCFSGSAPGTIADDIDGATAAGDVDKDPDPGQFQLARVCLAAYTITESSAPINFAIDPDPTRLQTVSDANLTAVIGTQGSNQAGTTDESDFHNPANSAPTVNRVNATVTVNEGQTAANTGTYSDSNAGQDVAITASVGTVNKTGTNSGTWSWSFTTNDGPTQSQTVTITANDGAGGTATTTFALVVNNVAPTATLGNNGPISEGGSATVSFTGQSDPSTADTTAGFHYAYSCTNGDLSGATYAGSGTSTSTSCSFDDNGSFPVKARIIDKDGGFTEYTTTVVVNNVAPTATLGNNGPISEGGSATVSFTGQSDPSTADTTAGFHYAYSCTNGDLSGATYAGSGTSTSTSCSFDDNGSFPVKARIIDKDGGFTEYTTTVVVNNVAPTATLGNNGPISEGGSATVSFTGQSDPSTADTTAGFHYAYSCTNGDLSGATYAGSGTSTSTSCSFDDNGSFPVKARIIDKDGGFTEYTTTVVVNNVAPTATFGADTPVDEGFASTVSLTGPIDPSTADTTAGFHYAFACYGESLAGATYAGAGTTASVVCSYDDGPIQHTVRARIIDKDGGFTEYSALVTIDNVSPTATFSNSGPIDEGGSATITFSDPSDPSNADTTAGFGYSFACDGLDASLALTYAGSGASDSTSCPFDDGPSSPVVKGRIFDKDDGYTQYSTTVTVNNVAPTATFGNDGPVNEGSSFTLSLTGPFDPSSADTTAGFTYAFDCGDGSGFGSFGASSSASCPTTDNGVRSVGGKIRDKDGGISTYTASVTVDNVDPTGTADEASVTVDEGDTATNTGTYFDPGADPITLTASVGTMTDNLDGTWSWSFGTTDGPDESQTVTVYGDDGDGAGPVAIATFSLVVDNVDPTGTADEASVTVDEGDTATNTGTYFDPGADPITLTASVGTMTDNLDGTWSWSFGTTDGPDESQTVTVYGDDGDGAGPVAIATFSLVVDNVDPTGTADEASVTVDEGDTATNTGTYFDPGADPITLTASVGTMTDNLDGTWSWSFGTTDGPDESQTVTVYGDDGDGAGPVAIATFSLVVDNVDPTGTADEASVTVDEGDTATNTGTYFDPGADPITLTASVGTMTDNLDGTWSWSFGTTDGPDESQTVTVYGDDGDGAGPVAIATFSLVVDNVDPTGTADEASVTVDEGDTATNTGTYFDPGADPITLTASVGTMTDNLDGTWSWSFGTTDGPDESQTVTVYGDDGDGAGPVAIATFSLVVDNVDPTGTADEASVTVDEGDTATNTGTYFDPGADPITLTASVGTMTDNLDGTWSWSFGTTDGPDESQTVTVYGDDGDGAGPVAIATFSLVVDNVDPTGTADEASVTVDEGDTATNTGTYFDPGADPITLTASVGTMTDNLDGTWSWSFGTTDGPDESQTVTVYGDDGDGAGPVAIATFSLVVDNVAPMTSNLAGDDNALESGVTVHTYTYDLFDPGDDTITAFPSCGLGGTLVGTPTNTSTGGTFDCRFLDGPASPSVTVFATDEDAPGNGNPGNTSTLAVSVANVAPEGTFGATTPVEEGASSLVSVSAPTDPSPTDTSAGFHYAFACDGESLAGATYANTAGNGPSTLCTYDDGPAAHTVRARIIDKDGGFTEYSALVSVDNVSPTATFSNSGPIDEGSSATASFTDEDDPSNADTAAGFHYAYSCINGDLSGATYAGSGTSDSTSCTFANDGSFPVKGRILDKDDGFSEYTTTVTVNNVAPDVDAGADQTIDEGDTFSGSGSFTDPGADTWTATVDYGEGAGEQPLTLIGQTFSLSNLYQQDGSFTVTVCVSDDDTIDCDTLTVTVNNVAPDVDAGADQTIDEGDTFSGSGSFTDPGADTWTATVDYGEGAGEQPLTLIGQTFSLSNLYQQDGSFTVTVCVSDDDTIDCDTLTVTVNNVAPDVDAGADQTIDEGDTFSGSGSFTDPGADTWTATVDYGEGAGEQPLTLIGQTFSLSNLYQQDGSFTVTVCVSDDDTIDCDTLTVTVNNVAPDVDAGADQTIDEGDTFSGSGSFTDPGADTWTATVDYGEGAGEQPLTLIGQTFSLSNLYQQDGSFTVTVCVSDDDTIDCDTLTVTVNNVAPDVDAGADQTIDEGDTFSGSGSFTDPGADTWTATVDYGEGAGEQPLTLIGQTFSLSNLYQQDGSFTVTVCVSDDDTIDCDTLTVTVNNVAPITSNLVGPTLVSEGATVHTYTYDLFDPGADTVTAHPSCGSGVIGAASNTNTGGSFECTFPDGPASPTVAVYATDDDTQGNTASLSVTVNNVDPTATLSNNGPVGEGSAATVSFSEQSDPSPVDTAAGFRYAYSCTNASLAGATYAGSSTSSTTTCTYGDNGSYTVRARIIDKDAGYSEYTTIVVVNNVNPSNTGSSFVFNPFTGNATATVSFSDPGWLDVVSSLFNWAGTPVAGTPSSYGPGTGPGPLTGTFSSSMDFAPGCFTSPVTVRVSDDNGGYFDQTFATSLNVYTVTWEAPLKDGERNVVKKGNVIPVKLRVVDCFGNAVTNRTLSIRVVAGIVDPADVDDGINEVPNSVSGADTTGFMRQVDSKYMYNMDTKTLSIGMPYTIVIRDGSLLVATAVIQPKK